MRPPLPRKPKVSTALGGGGALGPGPRPGRSAVQAGTLAFSRGSESLEDEGEGRGAGQREETETTGANTAGRGDVTYAT